MPFSTLKPWYRRLCVTTIGFEANPFLFPGPTSLRRIMRIDSLIWRNLRQGFGLLAGRRAARKLDRADRLQIEIPLFNFRLI